MRHHNVEVNSFYPSIRQTSDILKSNKIIDFVLKKNLNVCIVGNKNEKIIRHVELSYRDEIKKNKIFFLKNLCPDYKFSDQLYIFYKSLCYVGSHAGPLVPYYYLKKKAISFDVFYRSEWEKINFSNFIFLYKKIKIDNSIYILDDYYCKNIKKYNYDLIEVSADEIIDNLNKLLKDLYY